MAIIDRKSPGLGLLLALGGFLCTAFGSFAFGQSQKIAAAFLGADFLFGTPMTQTDTYKVLFVSAQSLGIIGFGLTMLASGVVIWIVIASRTQKPEEGAGATMPAASGRL